MDLSSIFAALGNGLSTAMGWIDSNPFSYFSFRTALFLYVFFALYVLAMGLYRAHLAGTMRKTGYILGWPWMVIAALVDVLANVTIFVVIFVEPPKEFLVTQRLKRHLKTGPAAGFRYRFARAICRHVLDYFDPRGAHCIPEAGPASEVK